ncbi:TetR-like C-terminal domain-containing protein [Rhodoferax sp.]|uniref:TetR-like C-terminal domain-containing protein n=1 Tax=Rhodoferax sp. TaxID=50421 RepID=UPI00260C20FF|nr:TetR-like C-terminal domain-containing protein [Rhodoferax sp.]MDD2925427.1 TetR-like C-terminal domain-containing protein [Rhodoferax sp.]
MTDVSSIGRPARNTYRHGDLRRALLEAGLELARAGGPAAVARASVRAVGMCYLRFAKAGDSGLNPFELLGAALDGLVTAGVLPPERRPGAEFLAWSAVHGLAMLVIDGPLGPAIGPRLLQVGQRLLDMVENGL